VPTLIDLSQEVYQGMPVYPGHVKTVVYDHHTHEETRGGFEGGFSYASKGLLMSDHGPTHVDALSHLDPRPGAASIDEMPLKSFFGPATCIDLSHKEPREYITAGDLDAAVGDADVRAGDILLLRTGTHDRLAGRAEYAHRYPGLDDSGAEWLVEREVKAFGVDAPSPDNPASRTYPVHMMCRERGITHFENLANLEAVVGRRFTFAAFPLKIRGGTGSPVRAVAILDEDGER
jgi:kynurenine formamidase